MSTYTMAEYAQRFGHGIETLQDIYDQLLHFLAVRSHDAALPSWADEKSALAVLEGDGLIEHDDSGRYVPTPRGWARIEARRSRWQ